MRAPRRAGGGTTRGRAGDSPSRPGPSSPAPPLFEIRRRARQRVREISSLLAIVRAEYLAAAEECSQLNALQPGLDPCAGEDAGHSTAALSVLLDKLRRTESALASAQQSNHDLQAHIAALEARRAARRDVANASTPNATVKDDVPDVLRFLDELTSILPPSSGPSASD